jgi:hypothetical protein
MDYRPFRSLGRFALAACAVSLGAASLGAQTPTTAAPMMGPNPSRVDVFTGFSYFGAHGQLKPAGIPYSSINLGAIGSGAYYFNKYVGIESIYANHPDGTNDGMSDASAGMIFRAPMQNFTVFAHGLAGAARLGGPNNEGAVGYHEPYMWGPSLAVGGGMDYDLPFFKHKFSLRLFEADYRWIHEDYGYYTGVPTAGVLGGRTNMSSVELSTGIVTHFGSIIPPPPVTYSCVAAPTTGYPGDPITVTGTPMNLNPKKMSSTTYNWTSDGGTVSGTTATATVDTKTLSAGTYTVKGHVSEGSKPGQMADCSAQFMVKAFEPPTIGCSANPSSVNPGDSSTITASGVSPQNRPLTYSYSATAGSISGSTSSATLSTAGAAPGTITVTCNVVDDKGQSASQMTTVRVIAPPVQPQAVVVPTTSSLCSVSFERDARRPTRVDNEAKACLDDIALNMQRQSDAKLALVGSVDAAEKKLSMKKAEERAVNTKEYLVAEKGVDASRIMVYTGADTGKTVSTVLIPTGATMDMTGDTAVDESKVKAVARTPAKRAMKKKK